MSLPGIRVKSLEENNRVLHEICVCLFTLDSQPSREHYREFEEKAFESGRSSLVKDSVKYAEELELES